MTAKLSINQLGEYMTASPTRRRGIVRSRKYPKGYIVGRYKPAKAAISQYWEGGNAEDVIENARQALDATGARKTAWQIEDATLSAEALEIFTEMDHPDFTGATFLPEAVAPATIQGVEISITRDLYPRFDATDEVGLVKLRISKNSSLSDEQGLYIATLLQHRAAQLGKGAPRASACCVVDVFSGNVFTAPKATKKRMADIEAACQEVALHWAAL